MILSRGIFRCPATCGSVRDRKRFSIGLQILTPRIARRPHLKTGCRREVSRRCFGERPPLLPPFRNAKTGKSNAEFQVAFGKKFNNNLLKKAAGRDEGRTRPTAENVSLAPLGGMPKQPPLGLA